MIQYKTTSPKTGTLIMLAILTAFFTIISTRSCGVVTTTIPLTGMLWNTEKYFGVSERATGEENAIFPVETEEGIQLMSMNCLLEHDEDPVVWRGALIPSTLLAPKISCFFLQSGHSK